MKHRRVILVIGTCAVLAGCASAPRHEVTISPKLREFPVRSVCVFEPVVRTKIKRRMPADFAEMKPDRAAETATKVNGILTAALGASLSVDSSCTMGEAAREWAEAIGQKLAEGRIPLHVDPIQLPVESVLVYAVHTYGAENQQTQITPLFMKPIPIGKPKYLHWSQVVAVLVKPQTGDILFDIQQGEAEERTELSLELLDELTRKVSAVLLEAFFPAP